MALMPGATIRLIPRHNGGAKRPKGRGTSFHVTASAAASMFGYFSTVGDCSHFHVAKDGTIEQYIDTDYYGAAQIDGNDMVIVETQGAAPGVNAETELWTPQQVASNARIARWVHDTEGAPLVLMPDSRSASRGVASHRLGIAPWRVAGGQVWSRKDGKVCPGSAKIAQLPEIVALAISGGTATTEDDMFSDADRQNLENLTRMMDAFKGGQEAGLYKPFFLATTVQGVAEVLHSEGVSGAGDPSHLAAALTPVLSAKLAQASDGSPAGTLTKEDVTAALREVLRAGVGS